MPTNNSALNAFSLLHPVSGLSSALIRDFLQSRRYGLNLAIQPSDLMRGVSFAPQLLQLLDRLM